MSAAFPTCGRFIGAFRNDMNVPLRSGENRLTEGQKRKYDISCGIRKRQKKIRQQAIM